MAINSTSITYLSPYFWPEEIGSAPYCTQLAAHLVAKGFQVDVHAFRPHYPDPATFGDWAGGRRDHEIYNGISIRRTAVSSRGTGSLSARLRNDIRLFGRLLVEAIKGPASRPDIIIAYVPSTIAVYGAILLKWRTGAKLVVVVHDIESGLAAKVGLANGRLVVGAMRAVERTALNTADRVIALTDGMKRAMVELGCRRRIDVLPIWTDPFPSRPFPDFAEPIVAYSGNFGKKQNLDQLVEPIRMLDRVRPNVRVLLRGEGSERKRIRSLLLDRHQVRNTTFEPLVPATQLGSSLQAAHVHLVPQASNIADYALPSKIVSIMAAGRPFVCIADRGSLLEKLVLSTGSGVCVPPGDSQAIFDAIDRLTSDPAMAQRMGRNGRQFVEENLSTATVLDRYVRSITEWDDRS